MELFGAARPRMLDIQAEYGLKPPQFFALNELDEPVPMSRIADTLRCDRSAVTWITDRLEERGYVERRRDERDRREHEPALDDGHHRAAGAPIRSANDSRTRPSNSDGSVPPASAK